MLWQRECGQRLPAGTSLMARMLHAPGLQHPTEASAAKRPPEKTLPTVGPDLAEGNGLGTQSGVCEGAL